MAIERFNIRRDTLWKVPLFAIGATENNSYVELRETDLVARFGVHESRVDYADILGSKQVEWPIWKGIGIRVNHSRGLGLVGSVDGVVEFSLKEGKTVKFMGIACGKLSCSLEEPERFLEALRAHMELKQ